MSWGLFITLVFSVAVLWGWKIWLDVRLSENLTWGVWGNRNEMGVLRMASILVLCFCLFLKNFVGLFTCLATVHILFWVCQDLWNNSDTRLLKLVQEQGKELHSLLPMTLTLELSPKINEMTVDTLQTLLAERKYLRNCVKVAHHNINEVRRRPSLYTKDTEEKLQEMSNELSERLKKVEMRIAAYQSTLGKMTADLYEAKISGSTPEEMQKYFDSFLARLEEEAENRRVAEAEVRALR